MSFWQPKWGCPSNILLDSTSETIEQSKVNCSPLVAHSSQIDSLSLPVLLAMENVPD